MKSSQSPLPGRAWARRWSFRSTRKKSDRKPHRPRRTRRLEHPGSPATAGFLIYLADASGYLGSVALLLWRDFGVVTLEWPPFFITSAYATAIIGGVFVTLAAVYFQRRR